MPEASKRACSISSTVRRSPTRSLAGIVVGTDALNLLPDHYHFIELGMLQQQHRRDDLGGAGRIAKLIGIEFIQHLAGAQVDREGGIGRQRRAGAAGRRRLARSLPGTRSTAAITKIAQILSRPASACTDFPNTYFNAGKKIPSAPPLPPVKIWQKIKGN